MRQPDIIVGEIHDLDKIIISTNELIYQFPDDNILSLNLEQTEYRKNLLLKELDESLGYYGRHSIKFIFTGIKEKISLETLLENLGSFKNLLDKTIEIVSGGSSNNLPIYFNTVFSSSYGIQLSTPFEGKLFDHDFEKAFLKTISTLNDLIISDDEGLKHIMEREFGNDWKFFNKYSIFFKKIYQTDKKIKIVWNSPITKKDSIVEIEPAKAKYLYSIFHIHEKKEDIIELFGILKGLSLIRYKVEFVKDVDGKELIIAKFDESLTEEVKDALDKYVIAQFKVISEFNELTEEVQKKYILLSVHHKST